MQRFLMLVAVVCTAGFVIAPTNAGEKGETKKSGTAKSTSKETKATKKADFDVNALGEKETKKTSKSTSTEKSTKKTEKTAGLVLLGEKGETKKSTSKSDKSGKTEKGETKKSARLSIGDMAPSFANLPNATIPGKKMGLDDCKSDVLVVCITCNHCPVAVMYEDRMIAFAKKYDVMNKTAKVGFVAINVNNSEQDKLPKMEERAREKGFNFPYLYDESQAIAKALNATVTPEFYVFDKNRKLIYHGPLDDNNTAASAKTNLLEAAVEAGLKGELPTVTEAKARGCGVQYGR